MKKPISVEQKILKKISSVMDPELYVSIVDLGLVYDVAVKKNIALITMTLTTLGCPLFSLIEKQVEQKTMEVEGIDVVKVALTFDPPWSMDRMTEKAKAALGI